MVSLEDSDLHGRVTGRVDGPAHIHEGRSRQKGQRFVDAEAVEAALVKGFSRHEDVCAVVGELWSLACRLDILLHLDRVSANIADQPSRGDMSLAAMCDWVIVEPVLPAWGPG